MEDATSKNLSQEMRETCGQPVWLDQETGHSAVFGLGSSQISAKLSDVGEYRV